MVALLSAVVGISPQADAETPPSVAPAAVLDEVVNGAEAVAALGAGLPTVAAAAGMSPAELTADLLTDETLHVDRTGTLLFVDTGLAPAEQSLGAEPPAEPAPFPYADTFKLHSKPTSSRTIYLDFTGHVVNGTAWNTSYTAGNSFTASAFDADGDAASFSNEERDTIQSVWQRIAEDYAPFDVDVTTEEPDQAKLTRADANDTVFGTRLVITNTDTIYGVCSCGGIAYKGVFDATTNHAAYQPAFVFTKDDQSAKFIAEAGSHEVGHNLGLDHDGTAAAGYYSGHAMWAPIMGVGYSKAVTQWSKGEYKGANNKQDDFVVMQENGAPIRTDDFGDKLVTAAFLGATFPVDEDGVISHAKDIDMFKFNAGAGEVTITVDGAPTSPNLDIAAQLLTAKGKALVKVNDVSTNGDGDTATGMNASITATLPAAGTYYVRVEGSANGSGTAGYSKYGSLGAYTVSIEATAPSGLTNILPTAKVTLPLKTIGVPGPATLTNDGSWDPDGRIAATAWDFGDGTAAGSGASVTHTYSTTGTYEISMTVTDDSGATATKTASIKAVPAITVDSITGGTVTSSGKTYAAVTVKVVDAADAAVVGAKVTVNWTGTKKGSGNATTGADGTAVVKGPLAATGSSFTATVTKVTLKDKAYNAGLAAATSVAQSF